MPEKVRHARVTKGRWFYQRAMPSRLKDVCSKLNLPSLMVKPLDLTDAAPKWKVEKGVADWNLVFDDVVSLIDNTDVEGVSQEERKRKVRSLLKTYDLAEGMFAGAATDDNASDGLDHALDLMFDDDRYQLHPQFKGKPRYTEDFIREAIDLLTTEQPHGTRLTFAEAYDIYFKYREGKSSEKEVKKDRGFVKAFMATSGNQLLTTENAARYLKAYRNKLQDEGRKGSTVARMLNPVRAGLAYAAERELDDVFVPVLKVEGSTQHADRYTLTAQEMVELAKVVTDKSQAMPDYVRLFYTIALHCGGHALEIRNTLTSDLVETPEGWQVFIRGTKTSSRPRTIPLMEPMVPWIQRWLPLGDSVSVLADAGSITDSALSHAFKPPIAQVNPKATPYSLRHGFRNLAIAEGVTSDVQQLLSGWTDGSVGKHQKRYSAGGEANADQMAAKRKALERMLRRVAVVYRERG